MWPVFYSFLSFFFFFFFNLYFFQASVIHQDFLRFIHVDDHDLIRKNLLPFPEDEEEQVCFVVFSIFFLAMSKIFYCNSSAHWIRPHKNLVMVYHLAESLWLSDSIKVWNAKVQDSIPHKDYNFFLCLMLMTGQ